MNTKSQKRLVSHSRNVGSDEPAIDLDAARARLGVERTRVERLIAVKRAEIDELRGRESDRGAEYEQLEDTATEIVERQQDEALLDRLYERLDEVAAAVRRVDARTYGRDEITGEPIDPERLRAFPTARLNVGQQQHTVARRG